MTATVCEATPTAEVRTWTLHQAQIEATIYKLQAINARAALKGLSGVYTWTTGPAIETPVYAGNSPQPNYPGDEPLYFEITHEFSVFGSAPKLAGWSFIATLTWDGVLVTRTHPAFEGRIDESTLRERWCDHCKSERNRIDTYLLQNEDGRRVQVGSTCIKDFLGHSFSPSWLSSLDADLDAIEGGFGGYSYEDCDIESVLVWAESLVRVTGWVSVAKAEERGLTASSGLLKALLFAGGEGHRSDRKDCFCGNCLRARYTPTEDNRLTAKLVLAWARQIVPGDSEYFANLRRLADTNFIGRRNVGLLGSAVAAYWREHNERIERAARPVSHFQGAIKDKLQVAVTLQFENVVEGYYGVTHIYTFVDAAGNVFKWFASRDQDWAIGKELTIKGTVKAHETYKDVEQTVLTRCTEVAA